MRKFDLEKYISELLKPDIINLVSSIHEYKGKQELFMESKPDILNTLLEVAKIQSTGSSNRIEGIYTSDARLKELVQKKTEPRNRSEKEIAGYREVLQTIHENYDYIPLNLNMILQLHRDLYIYSSSSFGGHFKNSDNTIEEVNSDGVRIERFRPVSAFETPQYIETLCSEFKKSLIQSKIDSLILIPMFILDFLCIHPFNDGNGRMSRLLTLLLLYQEGYIVGKYISLETIIEKTKETYYDTLQDCSINWHEGKNKYTSFIKYFLGIVLNAYKEFSSRVEYLRKKGTTKAERIKNLFDDRIGKLSKIEISILYPDISITTIERTLANLLKEDYILKIGSGKNTEYIKNPKKR